MSKVRSSLALAALASVFATFAAHAEDVMRPAQAMDHFARMEALGERCAEDAPSLRPAISNMWTSGFDKATANWVVEMRKGPEYATVLAKARTEWTEAPERQRMLSCQAAFGTGEAQSKAIDALREMDETMPRRATNR
ncbi:hypothetical protein [Massilia sp. 9096]|uniref:hypothetical protein n=1 Tax=Massilia sp. 9096 TaxID=1500894 RepID=UPI000564F9DF|nr:hypothetical protein [Massilia sp. 9096]